VHEPARTLVNTYIGAADASDPLRVHHLGAVSKGIHEKRVKITAAVPKNVS
jgi:hypothetical protein